MILKIESLLLYNPRNHDSKSSHPAHDDVAEPVQRMSRALLHGAPSVATMDMLRAAPMDTHSSNASSVTAHPTKAMADADAAEHSSGWHASAWTVGCCATVEG